MRILATALALTVFFGLLDSSAAEAAPAPAAATGKAAGSADTVDQKRVHSEYGDGNFETVTQILEDYRARHEHYRVADSVFIAKYLGVVYAANPDSREKGKYWLYKMLQMDPSQNLVDLYVGEAVQDIFEKVRSEFIVRRNYRGINDTKLNKAVADGEPVKIDTVVRKDTVVVKDNYLSPITDGIKGGYDEVKGGIKAGIQAGYVPIKEETKPDDSRITGNINVGAGLKLLNRDEWEPISGIYDQTEARLATDIRMRKWPINVALDFIYAWAPDAQQDFTSEGHGYADQSIVTMEIHGGVRKIFDFRLYSVRPFFGGGFGYLHTNWDLKGEDGWTATNRKGKIGIWLNGGVYWELDSHFNIGLDWAYSSARYYIYKDLNHGGQHFNMLLGYHY